MRHSRRSCSAPVALARLAVEQIVAVHRVHVVTGVNRRALAVSTRIRRHALADQTPLPIVEIERGVVVRRGGRGDVAKLVDVSLLRADGVRFQNNRAERVVLVEVERRRMGRAIVQIVGIQLLDRHAIQPVVRVKRDRPLRARCRAAGDRRIDREHGRVVLDDDAPARVDRAIRFDRRRRGAVQIGLDHIAVGIDAERTIEPVALVRCDLIVERVVSDRR